MEVCSLRDAGEDFLNYGVNVYGLSLDDVQSQAAFHKAQELNFALLSDPDGSVGTKYGVLGKDAKWTARVTFIIDDEGVLRHITDKINVREHGDEVLNLIEDLSAP